MNTAKANADADAPGPAALLQRWARAGAWASRAASFLGVIQFVLFAGFAWCAASALAALAAGNGFSIWLAGAAAFALARAGAQAGEARLGLEAAARVKSHVRRSAAEGLARRGPAYAERADTGETASALIDSVEKLEGYFARFRPLQPVVFIAPLIILAAAFPASYIVGAVFLVTAPLLAILMALVGAGAASASRDQMTVLRRLAGRFNDRLQALETLNAFNAAGRESQGLRAAAEDFRRRTMKVLRLAFLSSAVLEFFAAIAIAATAIYVGFSLLGEPPFDTGETVTLRTGVFVLLLAPEFYTPLRRLSAAYHDRADAEAAAEALAPLFAESPETARPAAAVLTRSPEIIFEQAGSVYPGGRRGLEPLSFTARAGRITALWGTSGAGKSTALKMLLGYAPLSEGGIVIDGEPLESPLTGCAAWIGQRPRLFHGTLCENITLFDTAMSRESIASAAEDAGVMDFAASLPGGLDTHIGDRGYGLSGGQAQRVALARALAADMKLLLLDEPTAHLDGEAEARFLEALKTAAQGRTVLIATHSPAARDVCDAVIDLEARRRSAA